MAKIKEQIEDFVPDQRLVDERGATPERIYKAGPHVDLSNIGRMTMRDCPLAKALKRDVINGDQYNAGSKFRHHWYHAGMSAKIGAIDPNKVFGGSSGMNVSERQVFHRQQYMLAAQKVGMRTEKILADVICWEHPLAMVGNAQLGMKSRQSAEIAVKALFINGLDMLVDLWGLRTK